MRTAEPLNPAIHVWRRNRLITDSQCPLEKNTSEMTIASHFFMLKALVYLLALLSHTSRSDVQNLNQNSGGISLFPGRQDFKFYPCGERYVNVLSKGHNDTHDDQQTVFRWNNTAMKPFIFDEPSSYIGCDITSFNLYPPLTFTLEFKDTSESETELKLKLLAKYSRRVEFNCIVSDGASKTVYKSGTLEGRYPHSRMLMSMRSTYQWQWKTVNAFVTCRLYTINTHKLDQDP